MKTRIITAIVGILVLIGVLFTFDTLVFNFVIAAITLIAIHEVFKALGFGRKEWPMYAVFVPYTLLIMLSSYQVWRRLVMPASFLMVLFFGIYLVVRNAQVDFAKASGLVMFSGIVIFCFYSFIRLKELLPVETYGYDAMFFILLILCFAWGGQTGEGGVLGRGAGFGQQAGGFLGLLAEQGHFLCQSHTGSLGWLVSLYAAAGTRARGRPPVRDAAVRPAILLFLGKGAGAEGGYMPLVPGKRPPGKRCVRLRDSLLPAGGFSLTEGRSLSYINRPHRDSSGDRGRSFCKEH